MLSRIGPLEIIILLAVLLLVFGGRGKISAMMQDMAKGIKSFRTGLKEGETDEKKDANLINVTPEKEKTQA
jgi:sec-independent protein translocase protein TatA